MAQRGEQIIIHCSLLIASLCLLTMLVPQCAAQEVSNSTVQAIVFDETKVEAVATDDSKVETKSTNNYGDGGYHSNSNSNTGGDSGRCGVTRCDRGKSCCSSISSAVCYDSNVQACFYPNWYTSVVCYKNEQLCGCKCFDPRYFYCSDGRIITPKPTPTTAKPTTAKPTTAKPTTAKPTTPAPTTKPTTAKPTTPAPTTAKPTTAKPTTAKPTTLAPTTAKPTTAKPTTPAPTTAKPTTAKPTVTPTPAPNAPPEVVFKVAADQPGNGIIISYIPDAQPGVVYDIYRSTTTFGNTSWPGVKLLVSNVNGTLYEDFNITQGTVYCYAVVARNNVTGAFFSNVTSQCAMVVEPITGLTCGNTGPVASGQNITFYSMVATGTGISYEWIVNDGGTNPQIGTGQNFTTVVYAATTTQATVVASNAKGSESCSTDFEVTS